MMKSSLSLSMEDFEDNPMVMDPSVSAFDALLEVARVASLKLIHHQQQSPNSSKRQHNLPTNPNPIPKRKRSHATHFHVLDLEHEKKKKSKNHHHFVGPSPTPNNTPTIMDLPDGFMKKIGEMGGSEVNLVIEKSLYHTDLSPQHNRLSIPMNQIKNTDFLREIESLLLKEKTEKGKCQGVDVVLVDPSLRVRKIVLGKWEMNKNSCYMLRSSWMKVANENGLTVSDVVQVWSFRVQQQLCMALVKLTS